MRTFGVVAAALMLVLSFVLSACASGSTGEAETPEREFFVEPEEREAPEPREPEGPATATGTGSSVHQPPPPPAQDPAPVPEDPVSEDPASDDPYYRPPGMDPCEEDAHGLVDNDACLEQNGVPRDS